MAPPATMDHGLCMNRRWTTTTKDRAAAMGDEGNVMAGSSLARETCEKRHNVFLIMMRLPLAPHEVQIVVNQALC